MDDFEHFRKILIALLSDLKPVKKRCGDVVHLAQGLKDPIPSEARALKEKCDELMHATLKLEQEMREI